MGRETQIIAERRRKLQELSDLGIPAYPQRFEPKDKAVDLQEKHKKLGKGKGSKAKAKVAGRLMTYRDLGNISFGVINDSTGSIQLTFQKKETPEDVRDFVKRFVDTGDIIGASGSIGRTKRGELSIIVKDLKLLAKSLLPLPEKWHGLQDKEERYRKRYLDLVMDQDTRALFRMRSKVIAKVREFLDKEGFLEVETPILQPVYGGASARPFKTHLNALDMEVFLAISPELYLKRLIVGGYEKVFTICKNFRNEGIDRQHNPEFTMMEYYAAFKNYEYHIEFTEKLFSFLLKELKLPDKIEAHGHKINLKPPFKKIKFRDLIKNKTGIDIDQANDMERLKKEIKSRALKIDIKEAGHYGALLDELYKNVVRPNIIQPTFLTHYPVEMIALAKRNEEDKKKVNSVQLLIDGSEIVKSYDELNDPLDQEARLREQADLLKTGDEGAMPMDEDFIQVLKHGMPPTAGYGLGIDRLLILLAQQESIRDVILFPFMKPLKTSKL